MPPESPNPVPTKIMPPHRLICLFAATVAPVFAVLWIVAELQGRRFGNLALLIMLTEGVVTTLLLTRLCQLWPDLLINWLRGTAPKGAWKKPAVVVGGIVLACLVNSFLSAYGLIGLLVERSTDSSAMF